MSKKVRFTFESELTPGNWILSDIIDEMIIHDLEDDNDKEAAKAAVSEEIELIWNGQLKPERGEKPRRVKDIVSVTEYVDPRRGDYDDNIWRDKELDGTEWDDHEDDDEFDF